MGRPNCMIDLETLGTRGDAIIVYIAAVVFNPETGIVASDTAFAVPIDWDSAVAAGRKLDLRTVKWWMKQNDQARAHILHDKCHSWHGALQEFVDWLPKGAIVWSRGPCFDIAMLQRAFEDAGMRIPWGHRDVRDVRTICDLASHLIVPEDIPFSGAKHCALDDTLHQAHYVSAMYQALKGIADSE